MTRGASRPPPPAGSPSTPPACGGCRRGRSRRAPCRPPTPATRTWPAPAPAPAAPPAAGARASRRLVGIALLVHPPDDAGVEPPLPHGGVDLHLRGSAVLV